eukprot:9765-Heterococcus_DN1.PRE.2
MESDSVPTTKGTQAVQESPPVAACEKISRASAIHAAPLSAAASAAAHARDYRSARTGVRRVRLSCAIAASIWEASIVKNDEVSYLQIRIMMDNWRLHWLANNDRGGGSELQAGRQIQVRMDRGALTAG